MKDEEEEHGRLLPAVCPGGFPGSHADAVATARVPRMASLISAPNALKDLSRETPLHQHSCTALSQHMLDWHMSAEQRESSVLKGTPVDSSKKQSKEQEY